MIWMSNKFTDLQIDVLKELVNVGGGNAATSISKMVDKPVDMEVPTIKVLNYNQVYDTIMSEDTIVNAVAMNITGAGEGIFLFVIGMECTDKLVNMIFPGGSDMDEEMKGSMLKELVNILVSSFLSSVGKMLEVDLAVTVPNLAVDMFGAIVSSVYIESGQYDEELMIIKNEFHYEGETVESSLYFVPKPGVLEELFKSIGM